MKTKLLVVAKCAVVGLLAYACGFVFGNIFPVLLYSSGFLFGIIASYVMRKQYDKGH